MATGQCLRKEVTPFLLCAKKWKMNITDKGIIGKIFSRLPEDFLPGEIPHVANAVRTKNDGLPPAWSGDKTFKVGREYPVYDGGEGLFILGPDQRAWKIVPACWKITKKHNNEKIYH